MLTEELNLNQNAVKVLQKRYLSKDEEGNNIETPAEMFRRVARCIALADANYGASADDVKRMEDVFYAMMTSLEFLPNSPTLMNAGKKLGQLSACFVLPVEDSMESIFDAVKNAAIIHKSGGGTGFSFSRLRPNGDVVGSTKGVSSGPISFMTVFDAATEAVKQGGTRRGANMGMLRVDHPDIVNFISSKDDNARLNNFNVSVALTDAFMRAVEQDGYYNLMNPRTGAVGGSKKAREVFGLIVNHAWKNGEPGIVFIDRINESNPTPHIGTIESTNPCGEQPLLPFESCNLGSINLAKMLMKRGDNCAVDWQKLASTTRNSVHFLDNVIDANKYPIDRIEKMTKANRKIGLGVMGWADMLIMLGIPYNSAEAVRLAEETMGFINKEAMSASADLAKSRGSFPNFKGSIYDGKSPMRNATATTIAPTGTLSIIAGCSSGIEPLFAVSFVRTVLEGTKLIEVNPLFESVAKSRGFWSRELMEKIAEEGSLHHVEEVPDDVRKLFVTAHDITPVEHVSMQGAFQRHVNNAVSKTVNFPKSANAKDVEDVYMLAYRLNCKGVTVYRDGSRDEQVLSTGKSRQAGAKGDYAAAEPIKPRKRPEIMIGTTRLIKTGCGNLYVTINADEEGNVFEVFTSMGKAGGCASSQAEGLGRLISLALRSNVDKYEIIKQLKGIYCHQPYWQITSCADALAKSIENYKAPAKDAGGNGNGHGGHGCAASASAVDGGGAVMMKPAETAVMADEDKLVIGACPECGGTVEHEGGCAVCHNCGFTKCG